MSAVSFGECFEQRSSQLTNFPGAAVERSQGNEDGATYHNSCFLRSNADIWGIQAGTESTPSTYHQKFIKPSECANLYNTTTTNNNRDTNSSSSSGSGKGTPTSNTQGLDGGRLAAATEAAAAMAPSTIFPTSTPSVTVTSPSYLVKMNQTEFQFYTQLYNYMHHGFSGYPQTPPHYSVIDYCGPDQDTGFAPHPFHMSQNAAPVNPLPSFMMQNNLAAAGGGGGGDLVSGNIYQPQHQACDTIEQAPLSAAAAATTPQVLPAALSMATLAAISGAAAMTCGTPHQQQHSYSSSHKHYTNIKQGSFNGDTSTSTNATTVTTNSNDHFISNCPSPIHHRRSQPPRRQHYQQQQQQQETTTASNVMMAMALLSQQQPDSMRGSVHSSGNNSSNISQNNISPYTNLFASVAAAAAAAATHKTSSSPDSVILGCTTSNTNAFEEGAIRSEQQQQQQQKTRAGSEVDTDVDGMMTTAAAATMMMGDVLSGQGQGRTAASAVAGMQHPMTSVPSALNGAHPQIQTQPLHMIGALPPQKQPQQCQDQQQQNIFLTDATGTKMSIGSKGNEGGSGGGGGSAYQNQWNNNVNVLCNMPGTSLLLRSSIDVLKVWTNSLRESGRNLFASLSTEGGYSGAPTPGKQRTVCTDDVQFIYVLKHQYRRSICASPKKFTVGTVVVLDGDMGVEMGTVSTVVSKMEFLNMSEERREELHLPWRLEEALTAMVYREATDEEISLYNVSLLQLGTNTLAFLNQLTQQEGIGLIFRSCRIDFMTFVACEFQADVKKLYVHYCSQRPIRFLEVATFLNQIFHCRIWMHEILQDKKALAC